MDKITFLGAGSTVFAKNVLGDCITTDAMREFEYALYDIDHQRLEESYMMLSNINRNSNDGKAKVVKYADRLDALRGAKELHVSLCRAHDNIQPRSLLCRVS